MINTPRVPVRVDKPVIPAALAVEVEHIVSLRVARVAIHQVLHSRVGVVDPDRFAESPHYHAVTVGGYNCIGDFHVKVILERGGGHRLLPVRRHARFHAVGRLGVWAGVGSP